MVGWGEVCHKPLIRAVGGCVGTVGWPLERRCMSRWPARSDGVYEQLLERCESVHEWLVGVECARVRVVSWSAEKGRVSG